MFKRITACMLSVILLLALSCTAFAAQANPVIVDLGDGFTMELTSTPAAARAAVEKASTATVKYSGTTIGKFTLEGRWTYNGSSATATNADHSVSTYSGWDYENDSSKYTGATVSGKCTFSKGSLSKSVSLRMTCDKNGNITTG